MICGAVNCCLKAPGLYIFAMVFRRALDKLNGAAYIRGGLSQFCLLFILIIFQYDFAVYLFIVYSLKPHLHGRKFLARLG